MHSCLHCLGWGIYEQIGSDHIASRNRFSSQTYLEISNWSVISIVRGEIWTWAPFRGKHLKSSNCNQTKWKALNIHDTRIYLRKILQNHSHQTSLCQRSCKEYISLSFKSKKTISISQLFRGNIYRNWRNQNFQPKTNWQYYILQCKTLQSWCGIYSSSQHTPNMWHELSHTFRQPILGMWEHVCLMGLNVDCILW